MRKRTPADFDPGELSLEPGDDGDSGALPDDGRRTGGRTLWRPRPVPEPTIDPALLRLGWWERSAEVIRFTLLCLEHWLSQRGILREWLRLNLWAAAVLAAASVLVIPPLTSVLEGAAEFTGLFGKIVGNMTEAALKLPPVVLGFATLALLSRVLFRQWRQRRRGGYGRNELEEYQ